MDIKKRLDDELKKVVEDKERIKQRFERRVAERRVWAAPLIEAARAMESETAEYNDVVWETEDLSVGVRLGSQGRRGYRRLEIVVMPPAPDRERAVFVVRQTDANGDEISETTYTSVEESIDALIKTVGEHVVNADAEPENQDNPAVAGLSSQKTKKEATSALRVMTYVLVSLIGVLALFAGWFLVVEMQAVPDDIADKGVRTIGRIWERFLRLLDQS